jgi:uncharacterized protein GlcG (DUF336 family)
MSVTLRQAKELLDRAEEAAEQIAVDVSIAVVDDHGALVAVARMDGSRTFTPQIATGKAKAAAIFQRPNDAYAAVSDTATFNIINGLNNNDLVFVAGGLPIERDGRVVGGLGISGGRPTQDVEIARATLGLAEEA